MQTGFKSDLVHARIAPRVQQAPRCRQQGTEPISIEAATFQYQRRPAQLRYVKHTGIKQITRHLVVPCCLVLTTPAIKGKIQQLWLTITGY